MCPAAAVALQTGVYTERVAINCESTPNTGQKMKRKVWRNKALLGTSPQPLPKESFTTLSLPLELGKKKYSQSGSW